METIKKNSILVIEDETHIANGIKLNLLLKGNDVKIASDGKKGLDLWKSWNPDLIVLDIMLPSIDGFLVLKTIREQDDQIPVLILSAKKETQDKIRGLKYGVDDYLSKPFDLEEFLLRIERLLKKKTWYQETKNQEHEIFNKPSYSFGNNHIDFVNFKTKCTIGEITLTEQEIILLKIFIANKKRPLSRQMLLNTGWGYSKDTTTRTLDNFIVRFRKYFETNPKKPIYFVTLRSIGYIFDHD